MNKTTRALILTATLSAAPLLATVAGATATCDTSLDPACTNPPALEIQTAADSMAQGTALMALTGGPILIAVGIATRHVIYWIRGK